MKTIFRSVNLAVLLAAILAIGAVAGFAQTPAPTANPACSEPAMNDLDAKIRKSSEDSKPLTAAGLAAAKAFVNDGKEYLQKYGACTSQPEFVAWLQTRVPKMETETIPEKQKALDKLVLVKRFDEGLKAKNWDEVYAAGKEIIAKYPEEYRTAEIVLGSIGYSELYDKANGKYNDDTLKYAKMSIADLEAGKSFVLGKDTRYGIGEFQYPDKEDALGWLNLYVGYITQVGQKNKKDAQPYLYKATQIVSAASKSQASKQPIPYEMIGNYYFDELNKLTKEVTAMIADQKETDPPEVAKQKVEDIKAKVALANGTAERAMDAFARAYNLGVAKAYKDLMYKNLQDAFKVRYGKTDALNASWIAEAVKKPLPNPTTPVTPIADPDAVTTTTTTGTAPVTPPATPAKPPTAPPANTTAKPPAKPSSSVPAKKAVAKKAV